MITLTLPDDTSLGPLITALCQQIEREDERGGVSAARALRELAKQLDAEDERRRAPVREWLREQSNAADR